MNPEHQRIIQRNFSSLVDNVNVNKLIPKLIDKNVFTTQMLEPYLMNTERNQKREIFFNIQRRGPDAFKMLVESLKEIGDEKHRYLACLLEGKPCEKPKVETVHSGTSENNNEEGQVSSCLEGRNERDLPQNQVYGTHPYVLPLEQRPQHIRQLSLEAPSNVIINISDQPLIIKVKPAENFLDDYNHKVPTYRTRSNPRGVYLCINNVEFMNDLAAYRKGAEVDEENMKILFREMGFHTSVYRNQSKMDMERVIKDFGDEKKNPFLKKTDILVVSIMSHGEEGLTKESSVVLTQDFKQINVSWILEQFNNRNCPAFQNKPKIFIFQICRGDNINVGVLPYRTVQHDGYTRNVIRTMTDILVAYSTLPGDKAYRDVNLGTWYIQAICKAFMEHAYDTDVEGLLKIVDNSLANLRTGEGCMQTSCYENKAFKRCYLHPKKFED